MEFEFKVINIFPGETWYESNVVKVQNPTFQGSKFSVWGKYKVNINGLVYAEFNQQARWLTESKDWCGHTLSRHFSTVTEAITWLNFLLTYPPRDYRETKGIAKAPDMKGGK